MGFGDLNIYGVHEELGLLALILVALWLLGSTQKAEMRSSLAAKGALRGEAVAKRLLSAMCDAVVHLDPDFTIINASSISNPRWEEHGLNSEVSGEGIEHAKIV